MQYSSKEEIDLAESYIRSDYREGKIDIHQFRKEMMVMTRARAQSLTFHRNSKNMTERD